MAVVVLKELILIVSTLGGCVGLERTALLTVSTLGECGGLEETDFQQFPLWEAVVVLKKTDF